MTNTSRRSNRSSLTLLALVALLLAMSLGFAVLKGAAQTTLVDGVAASARAGDLPVGGAITHETMASPANPGWAFGAGAAVTGITGEWGLAPTAKSELGAFLLLGSGISGFVVLSLRRRRAAEPPASIADR